jgi:hypothetical protein
MFMECDTTDCYYKQLKRLQAENEELKAKFNNNSLCNRIQIYEADEARMRKALEEIRGIAKDNYYSCTDCDKQRKELNCNEKCNAYRLREIQDKINEVLDERN